MKKSPWDLSQMSGDDIDTLKRILRRRRSRLIPSDGLDADNLALNGIRPGLYEDLSHPEPRTPEIPAEYAEPVATRLVKKAGIGAAMVYTVAAGLQFLGKGYRNTVVCFALAALTLMLGSLARR